MNTSSQETLSNLIDCPICYCKYTDPITILCGHSYCRNCIINHLRQTPKCPICRVPITQNPKLISSNITIKQIVESLQPQQQQQYSKEDEQKEQPQQQDEKMNQEKKLIVLYSDQLIVPFVYQRVKLCNGQFSLLTNDQIKQLFQDGGEYIIMNRSQKQKVEEIGYYVKMQQVLISGRTYTAQVLCEEKMEILSIQQEEFQTQNHIKYTLPLAIAKILEEEKIDLSNRDNVEKLQMLLNLIKEFLTPYVFQNHQDSTSVVIQTYLAQTGIVQFLVNDLLQDETSLYRFSYVLPSVLRLTQDEKRKILKSQCLITRFIMINDSLQKFRNIKNPLMIFQIGESGLEMGRREIGILALIILVIMLIYLI